jgi:epoxyqueuosine reductase
MTPSALDRRAATLTSAAIKAKALELGFDLCGVSAAVAHPKLARLAQWIADGRAGEMHYLADSLDERLDPRVFLPTACSVISLAVVYNSSAAPASTSTDDERRASIARYARGDDYHDVLRARMRALVQWMADTHGPGLEALTCVDDGPVQERVFAEQAGLGWIGKNACVINPTLGSWLFIAEIVTNAELERDRPAVDQCGTCTRCLDACPTGAIVEPYVVDATRCLSYLTIEQRGEIDPSLRPAIGEQIYGCDICQDVCPWNRRAATSDDDAWRPRDGLLAPALIDLCVMTDEAWRPLLKGSAMRRAGMRRIRRSLAYAAAHLDPGDAQTALDAMSSQPSAQFPEVADAIAWARDRRV